VPRIAPTSSTLCQAGLLGLLLVGSAGTAAASEVYTYKIENGRLGEIGRYMDTVTRSGEDERIVSQLRVAVRILGIVLHREVADRTEVWHAGKLVQFDSVTTTNGDRVAVHGEARDGSFVITTPSGTEIASADIHPSNPWSAQISGAHVLMSTKTGKIETVLQATVDDAMVEVRGVSVPTRHFVFVTNKRQEVWKDARGVPVRFVSDEPVGPIDFVLVDETTTANPSDHAGVEPPSR
jgi:hypothetical protein